MYKDMYETTSKQPNIYASIHRCMPAFTQANIHVAHGRMVMSVIAIVTKSISMILTTAAMKRKHRLQP